MPYTINVNAIAYAIIARGIVCSVSHKFSGMISMPILLKNPANIVAINPPAIPPL
jgi:hypothetical protein